MLELTAYHLKLPAAMARKHAGDDRTLFEDLRGAATVALARAANAWRPDGGTTVDGYLWLCCERAIWSELDVYRDRQRRACVLSLSMISGEEMELLDVLVDRTARRPDAALEVREELEAALVLLSPRELEALLMRSEGLRLREIGKKLGVSTERARQIIDMAERRVRQARKEATAWYSG